MAIFTSSEFLAFHDMVMKSYENILHKSGTKCPSLNDEKYGLKNAGPNSLKEIIFSKYKLKYPKSGITSYNIRTFYERYNDAFYREDDITLNSLALDPLLTFLDINDVDDLWTKIRNESSLKKFKAHYFSLTSKSSKTFEISFSCTASTPPEKIKVKLIGFHESYPEEELSGEASFVKHSRGPFWIARLINNTGLDVSIYFASKCTTNSELLKNEDLIKAYMTGMNSIGDPFNLECTLVCNTANENLHRDAGLYHSIKREHSTIKREPDPMGDDFQVNNTNILDLSVLTNKCFMLLNIDAQNDYVVSKLQFAYSLCGNLQSPKYGAKPILTETNIINSKDPFIEFTVTFNSNITHKAFLLKSRLMALKNNILSGVFMTFMNKEISQHIFVMCQTADTFIPTVYKKSQIEEVSKNSRDLNNLLNALTKALLNSNTKNTV